MCYTTAESSGGGDQMYMYIAETHVHVFYEGGGFPPPKEPAIDDPTNIDYLAAKLKLANTFYSHIICMYVRRSRTEPPNF